MSKDDKSPVTIADITVQKTIEECLNTLYPSLNIQGEESKESTDTVDAAITADAITKARKKLITSKFLNIHHTGRMDFIEDQLRKTYTEDEISSSHFTTFNTKDAVVWIDPLDGTSDFIKGTLSAVTVLIGLSIKDKSRIGIVHNPYCAEDETVSKTIFGTGEAGAFKLLYNKDMTEQEQLERVPEYIEPFDHDEEPEEGHTIRVAASLSHFSDTIKKIIEAADPVETVRLGGAGNKCCNLALGNVDTYMHPSPGLKYWDLCAPESLIKAMGGISYNLYSERLTYPLSGDRKIMGLILTKNPPMYNELTRRLGPLMQTIVQTAKL